MYVFFYVLYVSLIINKLKVANSYLAY
jgi:hypothetical protein